MAKRGKQEEPQAVETLIVVPPDGGWGWLVVATSFICNFTADGTIYTFGIFLNDISASLGCSQTEVALANSLMTGFYFLSGPFIGALINKCGCRIISIIGGVGSGLSIFTTAYATKLYAVLLVYGVIGGLSFGMMYLPSIVVVGFYFERWRALATSIAVCGSSLGIICFPQIFAVLRSWDWRSKFRLLSAACVFCGFCSILYRPLQPVAVVIQDKLKKRSITSTIEEERETGLLLKYHNLTYPTTADMMRMSTFTLAESLERSTISADVNVPSTSRKQKNISKLSLTPSEKLKTVYEDEQLDNKCKRWCTICKRCCCCCRKSSCRRLRRSGAPSRPLYRDDIFYSGSLMMLPTYMSSKTSVPGHPSYKTQAMNYHMSVTRVMTQKEVQEGRCVCCPEAMKRALVTMLDVSLLKSPSFLLLSLSGFFTILGLYVPFLYVTDRSLGHGMKPELAYILISTVGIANTIGRILSGVLSSLPNINALLFSYVSLTICGASIIGSTLSFNESWQFTCISVFGCSVACVASLRSVIVVDMIGLEKLTSGFGINLLFQGVACLTGTPFSGFLINLTGDYEMSFYFSGSVILFSAFLLMPIKAVSNWEKRKRSRSP